MNPRSPIGVVLAGGAGTRFGRPKAAVEFEGLTLAARAAQTLEPLCERVVISLAPRQPDPAPGWPHVVDGGDRWRGPLAGIVAVASSVDRDSTLLVLACDYPRVTRSLLARVLGRTADDVDLRLAVGHDGREHPLVAAWWPPAIGRARRALAGGRRRVLDIVARSRVELVRPSPGDGPALLCNVNRPGDLARCDPTTGS